MGDFEQIWAFCAHMMHSYGRFEIFMRDLRNRAAQPDPCGILMPPPSPEYAHGLAKEQNSFPCNNYISSITASWCACSPPFRGTSYKGAAKLLPCVADPFCRCVAEKIEHIEYTRHGHTSAKPIPTHLAFRLQPLQDQLKLKTQRFRHAFSELINI